jgi:hypothetical protein
MSYSYASEALDKLRVALDANLSSEKGLTIADGLFAIAAAIDGLSRVLAASSVAQKEPEWNEGGW